MKKIVILAGAVTTVLLLLLIVFLTNNSAGPGLADEDEIVRHSTDPTLEYHQAGDDASLVDGTGGEVGYAQVLEHYRIWAQYPPDSRPLKASYSDQIEHQWIPLTPQPMPIIAPDGKITQPRHSCLLQPLNHTVTEGQQMQVTLRCQGLAGSDSANPSADDSPGVSIVVKNFRLVRYFDEKEFNTEQPVVTEGDRANDYTYRFTYVPRKDDWGDMELTVDFALPAENEEFTHTMKAHFFSSPIAPARFRGVVSEQIVDGSLVIVVQMNVRYAGRYTIEANLFNEEGPVGISRTDARLAAGSQTVELQFFGKIFHDQNAPGPYQLVGLRGIQDTGPLDPLDLTKSPEEVNELLAKIESTGPDRRTIPNWEGNYTSGAYRIEDFSNAEWDSPIKRERIARLSLLAGEY